MHTYTWEKLVKNATRLNPKTRGLNSPYTPKIELLGVIPFVGTKSCLVKLQMWGVTQNSLHQVTLLFSDCEIITGENSDISLWDYFKVEYKGEVYYVKKFDRLRNPLTSRCTCFTGDTKILLADGTEKSFKELEGKENFDVISYDEVNDRFDIVKAFACEKKKENTEIIRVTLDNNTYIDCTPDHLFLTRDGIWKQAKDLETNESLRAFYGKHNDNKIRRVLPNNKYQAVKLHKPEKEYYVYIYLDPRKPGNYNYKTCSFDFQPIYVGKGHKNRCYSHLNNHNKDRFHNTINKIINEGLEPIILKYSTELEEHVAYRIESELTHEIGLECEGKGPLLNCKHGGRGGLSGVAKVHAQKHMKENNPMKNPEIAKLVSMKNEENGNHEKFRKLFKENNPMKNPELVEKRKNTIYNDYNKETRSAWGYNACHSLDYEERKKLGMHVAECNRIAVANGTHHTLSKKWQEQMSRIAKKNYSDPIKKQKILFKRKRSCTINEFCKIIKQNGTFIESLYKPNKRMFTINYLKDNNIFNELLQESYNKCFINHKVTKIEKISNADVYCLTTQYLGNFIVSCPDKDSDILSGVVVSNCKDYFFTFAYWCLKAGCLYGPVPRPYRRKTTWLPERNPLHIPGACKHIVNAWSFLKTKGFTVN